MVVLQGPILISSLLSMMLASFGAARAEAEAPVSGESVQELAYVGSTMWGGANDFVVKDGVAYIAMRNGVRILDVIDPTNMILVSEHYLNEQALAVDVEGDLLYVNCELSGTLIFDVSDPSHLVEVGSYPPGCWWGRALEVEGQHAYLGCQFGMQILDVSDPTHPEFISNFYVPSDSGYYPQNLRVVNDTVYLAAGYLWVIDVTDKSDPQEVRRFRYDDWWYYVQDAVPRDSLVYIANRSNWEEPPVWSSLNVVNISSGSEEPDVLSDTRLGGNHIYSAELWNEILICGTYRSGVLLYDIADPYSPSIRSCIPVQGGSSRAVFSTGNILFVMNQAYYSEFPTYSDACDTTTAPPITAAEVSVLTDGDFAALDITDSYSPELLGKYGFSGRASGIALSDTLAAVLDQTGTVVLLNVSDDTHPETLATMKLPTGCESASIRDSLLIVADGRKSIYIIDIADPRLPTLISSFDSLQHAYSITAVGDYIFAIDAGVELRIIDISDPQTPRTVGAYSPPGFALRVAVVGLFAFVTDRSGLQIVDISDPGNPQWRATYRDTSDSRWTANVRTQGNRLVLEGDQTIEILDITSPTEPIRLSKYTPPVTYYGIADMCLAGDYLVLSRVWNGVQVLDVSNPHQPTLVYVYDTPGAAIGAAARDKSVFVADIYSLLSLKIPVITDIDEGDGSIPQIPARFELGQNYPNPCNPGTTIPFSLTQSAYAELSIFNVLGQKITSLINGRLPAGYHSAVWDGTDSKGEPVSSGVYFYQLTVDSRGTGRKMLLLK